MFQKCDENSCLPPICILTFKIGGLKAQDPCIYLHTLPFLTYLSLVVTHKYYPLCWHVLNPDRSRELTLKLSRLFLTVEVELETAVPSKVMRLTNWWWQIHWANADCSSNAGLRDWPCVWSNSRRRTRAPPCLKGASSLPEERDIRCSFQIHWGEASQQRQPSKWQAGCHCTFR